ncbi:MAG: hypothetical protein J0L63_20180, partial [Anaerolineae bacterium]|nr:hypothetical protein [Anaerolineae bacterium]
MMNEETRRGLRQLLPPLKTLASSVQRAYETELYNGTGNMAVKSYRNLHGRIVALLADDTYVSEALALDVGDEADEAQKVAQVYLAASQLVPYLEGMVREAYPPPPPPPIPPVPPVPPMNEEGHP